MQYQPIHQGAPHSNNGNMGGHLPHADHYTLTPNHTPHSSATKPRSRTFHDMDDDVHDVEHASHQLQPQHGHHHHHHQLPNHNGYHHPDQPPPLKIQRADFEDLLGRTSMPMGGPGSLLGGPPSLQAPGQSAQMFAPTGLGNQGHLSPIEPLRQGQGGPPMLGPVPGSPHMSHGAQSMTTAVGAPGMPMPMPRPRGPKLKFTPEDDALLLELKENRALTWKQIAEFFPGRSSGTLQVRYCTKLKAKTTQWTDDTVQRLRNAMQEQPRATTIVPAYGPAYAAIYATIHAAANVTDPAAIHTTADVTTYFTTATAVSAAFDSTAA
ncbi:hypothetical protein TWF970_005959 [Orbilia oligospora]|uniref:Myb-like domain-containing protein n=1 Tax=Orbilia oligospora TaxID=2813651 RepID=A0A7C8RAQ7_ORBOL|nr:hypothetical protein TWF970_005959 [Orbilia oligospora]